MTRRPAAGSLRWRLLAGTLVGVVVALVLAGLVLADLFHQEARRQFEAGLRLQLGQLTAAFDVEGDGQPTLVPEPVDVRWQTPYSGAYWQIDRRPQGGAVLRSRSLWDAALAVPADVAADGEVHWHDAIGPGGARLRVAERSVRLVDRPGEVWMLRVAQDTAVSDAAVGRFVRVLVLSLGVLAVLLLAAAWAQVRVGLAPLRSLQMALVDLREGRRQRLEGRFPTELDPLVNDFNAVLARNEQVVARARTQAGNLAHAIKTPLAVLAGAAAAVPREGAAAELARLVDEQVAQARRQVDCHLARSRAAAAAGVPGLRTPVAAVVAPLLRVMDRVHAARHLDLDDRTVLSPLCFAGESQDLQEMLGNLLDNACKWARTTVQVTVETAPDQVPESASPQLVLVVEDDGPGLADAAWRERALARGACADEQVPGSGLGLAIVDELARLYGGSVALDRSVALGGLRAVLTLPRAP
jgi:signal transduction histidine kinase